MAPRVGRSTGDVFTVPEGIFYPFSWRVVLRGFPLHQRFGPLSPKAAMRAPRFLTTPL